MPAAERVSSGFLEGVCDEEGLGGMVGMLLLRGGLAVTSDGRDLNG